MQEIKIIFKSGRETIINLHEGESFQTFWEKATAFKFYIAGDLMINTDEIEYSETII